MRDSERGCSPRRSFESSYKEEKLALLAENTKAKAEVAAADAAAREALAEARRLGREIGESNWCGSFTRFNETSLFVSDSSNQKPNFHTLKLRHDHRRFSCASRSCC